MYEKLIEIEKTIRIDLKNINTFKNLNSIKVKYLGKNGLMTHLTKGFENLESKKKAEFGLQINKLKNKIQNLLADREEELKKKFYLAQVENEWVDFTINFQRKVGALHPIHQVQYQLEDIFVSMGFAVLDGPHIETEFYNFEALNIPKNHPARDMQDTFFIADNYFLRSQTSCIQIRGMQMLDVPIKIIGPGKVFRAERTDSSHDSCFHQIEGMVVDKNISVANMLYFMEIMLEKVFGQVIKFRVRPGYFPFVEPGFELDIACRICDGKGCKVCKRIGWVETLGCGMIHPNVLKSCKIDYQKYSGFAFGLGVDRLAMMKFQIDDIRYFHGSDIEFASQFV